MSTYDLSGTVYKILPGVFAETCKLTECEVFVELESGAGLSPDDRLGRLTARKAHAIATAICAELALLEHEADREHAKRSGQRGQRTV